jgi:DNA-binding IscR family transcriptional regulator
MTDVQANLKRASAMRLGFTGYVKILSAIRLTPSTTEQVAQTFGVTLNTMRHVMRSLHRMGLIHRGSWVKPNRNSILVPVWHFGQDGDVVPLAAPKRNAHRKARSAAIMLGTIAECLRDGPMSMNDLAKEIGIHRETCIRLVRILRDNNMAWIAGWQRNPGHPIPLYAFGSGKDAKKPKPLGRTPEQARKYSATHYAKQRQLRILHALAGVAA